jgi:hypothetical protein
MHQNGKSRRVLIFWDVKPCSLTLVMNTLLPFSGLNNKPSKVQAERKAIAGNLLGLLFVPEDGSSVSPM